MNVFEHHVRLSTSLSLRTACLNASKRSCVQACGPGPIMMLGGSRANFTGRSIGLLFFADMTLTIAAALYFYWRRLIKFLFKFGTLQTRGGGYITGSPGLQSSQLLPSSGPAGRLC